MWPNDWETQLRARVHLAHAQLEIRLPELPGSAPLAGAEPRLLFAGSAAGRERAPRAAARLDALLADLPDLDVASSLVHGDVRGAPTCLSTPDRWPHCWTTTA